MPLSTAAKAVLCLCPPAVLAGTVATVPVAKRAVHHMTAPHHVARPVRRIATSAAAPGAQAVRQPDCAPAAGGALPAVPLVTYAAPIPDEPVGANGPSTNSGFNPASAALAASSPAILAVTPTAPGTPAAPVVGNPSAGPGAVPEPASWAMMILGAGAVGAAWRRRRRARGVRGPATGFGAKTTSGVTLWAASAAAETGDVAATVAAKSAMASAAGKALLCVCPAAIAAGSVVAVPPLRQAVHGFTAPAPTAALSAPRPGAVVPCDPAMAIPVAATFVKGFPDVVSTLFPAAQLAAVGSAPTIVPFYTPDLSEGQP